MRVFSKKSVFYSLIILLAFIFGFNQGYCEAQNNRQQALNYLKNLSIEELASLEVTSVSKTSEKLSDADAAIYVITSEDIRRSGLTSLPELLRMVPGMQVASIDGNKWAISARGFNAWFADKLLVLIDGRSVYTPLFSGVYWDVQDLMLDDVERIEVIRGPGATLWGANAVNGVINIITKRAEDTQGGLLNIGSGNYEQVFGSSRYGGKVGDKLWYRFYAKYFNRDDFKGYKNIDANDNWQQGRTGFRIDYHHSNTSFFTFQGDVYLGEADEVINLPSVIRSFKSSNLSNDMNGGYLMGKWQKHISDDSEMKLQFYYDRTFRKSPYLKESRNTFDLDFQHSFRAFDRHFIVWGAGYRLTLDDISGSSAFSFSPKKRTDDLISWFFQDKITLIKDRLDLTIGSKFEYNDYSGFEVQPSGRMMFKITENQTFWAAISRAVRTPSRSDHDMFLVLRETKVGPTSVKLVIRGNKDFDSEELIAYEVGYRFIPEYRFSFDIAGFYNVYRGLRTNKPGEPEPPWSQWPPPAERILPLEIVNQYHEDSYGFEIASTVQLVDWWKLNLTYSWLELNLKTKKRVNDLELAEGNVPKNQFSVRSYMDLPKNLQLDCMLFYVDSLPNLDIDSYVRFDVRLGWNPTKNLSFTLKLQNLFDNAHREYTNIGVISSSQVPRSVYGKITWNF